MSNEYKLTEILSALKRIEYHLDPDPYKAEKRRIEEIRDLHLRFNLITREVAMKSIEAIQKGVPNKEDALRKLKFKRSSMLISDELYEEMKAKIINTVWVDQMANDVLRRINDEDNH